MSDTSIKKQLDELFIKYRTSLNPDVIAKQENNSFYIDEENETDLVNLTNLLVHSTFKNIEYFDNKENKISKVFGNALIDYCRQGLTHKDILNLLSLSLQYNQAVDKTLVNITDNDNILYSSEYDMLYGITIHDNNLYFQKDSYSDKIFHNVCACFNFICNKDKYTITDKNNNLIDYTIDNNNNTTSLITNIKADTDKLKISLSNTELSYLKLITYLYIMQNNKHISGKVYADSNNTNIINKLDTKLSIENVLNLIDNSNESNNNFLKYHVGENTGNMIYRKLQIYTYIDGKKINLYNTIIDEYIEFNSYDPEEANSSINKTSKFRLITRKYALAMMSNIVSSDTLIIDQQDKLDLNGNSMVDRNGNKIQEDKYTLYVNPGTEIELNKYIKNIEGIDANYRLVLQIIDSLNNKPVNTESDNKKYALSDLLYNIDTSYENLLAKFNNITKNSIATEISKIMDNDPIIFNTSAIIFNDPNKTYYRDTWNSLCDFKTFKKIKQNSMYINIVITNAQENEAESLIADDIQLGYISDQIYPTVFKLLNIKLSNNKIDNSIKTLISRFNNTNISEISNNVSVYILYKELNTNYRIVENSSDYELLISAYLYNKNDIKINSPIFIENYLVYKDTKIMSSKRYNELRCIKCNPFLARIYGENEIIVSEYGSSIGFGETEDDLTKIETFLECYNSIRNYYYDVIYNQSFVLDNYYKVYSFMYIIGFALDRYFSIESKNITDINKFTKEECLLFFNSYGLAEITDVIENRSIPNQTSYLKAIVSNYTNLLKYKGSKKIINVIKDIFDVAGTNIDISVDKYLLFERINKDISFIDSKEYDDPNDDPTKLVINRNGIKFVATDYSSTNSIANIIDNINYSENYDAFINNDSTWNLENIPESDIEALQISPETTKYLGVNLTADIYSYYIMNQYIFSALEYIQEKLGFNKTSDNVTIISNVKFNIENIEGAETLNLLELFELAKLLLSAYNLAHRKRGNLDPKIVSTKTKSKAKSTKEPKKQYYGINTNAKLEDLINYLQEHKFGYTLISSAKFDASDMNSMVTALNSLINIIKLNYPKLNITIDENTVLDRSTNESISNSTALNDIIGKYNYKIMLNTINDSESFDLYYFKYSNEEIKDQIYNVVFKTKACYINSSDTNTLIDVPVYYPYTLPTSATYSLNNMSYNKPLLIVSGMIKDTNEDINSKLTDKYSIINGFNLEYIDNYGTDITKLRNLKNIDSNTIVMLDDILSGINPIIALNENDKITVDQESNDISNMDLIQMLAFYNQAKGINNYNTEIIQSLDVNNIKNNPGVIYYNILEGMLEFPNLYLKGYFNPTKGNYINTLNYNHDYKIFIDGLFNTYFTTDENNYMYDMNTNAKPENKDEITKICNQLEKTIYGENLQNATDEFKNDVYNKFEAMIRYAFEDIATVNKGINDANNMTTTVCLKESSAIDDSALNNIIEKISDILDLLNAYFETYTYMNTKFSFTESNEAISQFMIALIKLFVSYTTNVYRTEIINKYDNQFERFIPSYSFKDTIRMNVSDILYNDESVSYKIRNNTKKENS